MFTLRYFDFSARMLHAINASPELRRRVAAKTLELHRRRLLVLLLRRCRAVHGR